jgi:hypothetical protein
MTLNSVENHLTELGEGLLVEQQVCARDSALPVVCLHLLGETVVTWRKHLCP